MALYELTLFVSLVNCSGCGEGDIAPAISCNGAEISYDIVKTAEDIYDIIFMPENTGQYGVHVEFSGVMIKGRLPLVNIQLCSH